MRASRIATTLFLGLLLTLGVGVASASAAGTISPADLVAQLQKKTGPKPLVIQVGFKSLFEQAHIPGSEYVGPGNDGVGIGALRKRLATVKKDAAIVIYCGCCPLDHCPNLRPVMDLLQSMGYTNAKMLLIPNNFGADWVAKGCPTERGR